MSLENAYYVSQILAAVAIAASLVFVGLQLRHGDRTQRAIMHQSIVHRTMEVTKFNHSADHAAVLAKMLTGVRVLTAQEAMMALGIIRINVLNLEDAIWQQSNGFLADDAVSTTIQASRRLFASLGARIAFEMYRSSFSQAQLALIDERVLKDLPMTLSADLAATWQATADSLRPPASA